MALKGETTDKIREQARNDESAAWQWEAIYNHDAALTFYKGTSHDPRGHEVRSCMLCGNWVGGSLGRFGHHLDAVHELKLVNSSTDRDKKLINFLNAACAAGASRREIAIYLGARVVAMPYKTEHLGQPAIQYIEEQVNLGREILAQIETLVGLGCTPGQIAEQFCNGGNHEG